MRGVSRTRSVSVEPALTIHPAEKQRVVTTAEIRGSIQPEGLISFEDGKVYKTLRRHLTVRGLTPEAYGAERFGPKPLRQSTAESGSFRRR